MKKTGIIIIIVLILVVILAFVFLKDNKDDNLSNNEKEVGKMQIKSVFNHNEKIPNIYTCDGEDKSPEIFISEVPGGAKSLVLIVDDPDAPAGTWVHWLLWNIDPGIASIGENSIPVGAKQGMNDFKKLEYGGPCPPSGTHRYFFKVYALDIELDLEEGSSKEELEKAMKGHMLDKAELIGVYSRG